MSLGSSLASKARRDLIKIKQGIDLIKIKSSCGLATCDPKDDQRFGGHSAVVIITKNVDAYIIMNQ